MKKIKRILVPVDFSYHANGAMRLAVSLANRWHAEVTVLHVDPVPGVGTMAVEPIYIAPQVFEGLHAEHDEKVRSYLQELRGDFAPRAAEGVTIETEHRRGEVVSGIVSYAKEWKADLMVMGSQGASGVSEMILGSVADKVSRVASCPVLIAGRADEDTDEVRSFRRVLAAVDYSQFSAPVARLAATLTASGGILELVHIWNQPYFSALNASLGGEREDLRAITEAGRKVEAERIQSFSGQLELPVTRIVHFVGTGTPALGILERADEVSADLIVLGSHSRTGLGERVIGTVADRVLRNAKVPVLLYPEGALAQKE